MLKATRKKLRISAFIAMLALASCTASSVSTVHFKENTPVTLTFSWWGNDERIDYTVSAVGEFEKENPDIDVNCKYAVWNGYTKRQGIYMNSSDMPDVMQINFDWIKTYSPDGNGFYDLNQLKDVFDFSNFTDEDLELGTVNGKLNAIPTALNTHCIFFNKDIYDKYGLELPKTWDDYFENAKVLREHDIYVSCMADKAEFFFILAYCEQVANKDSCDKDGKISLSVEDIEIMLDFYKRITDEKVVYQVKDSSFAMMANNQSASTMRWISGAQVLFDGLFQENKVNIAVAEFPRTKDTTNLGWYIKPATLYAISPTTQNPKEAGILLNYLLNSPEMAMYQQTEKGVPVSKTAIETLKNNGVGGDIDFVADALMKEHQDELKVMQPILEKEATYRTFFEEGAYYLYDKEDIHTVAQRIYDKYQENNAKQQ